MNEFTEMRTTLGEIAATLVGFSIIFGAFTGRRRADEHSRDRVTLIIEVGLVVVALCFLPELFLGWGLSGPTAFRVLSGITGVYWLRWLVLSYRIRNEEHHTPMLFRAAVVLHLVIVGLSGMNVMRGADVVYTSSVCAGLALVGLGFIAQFHVERD